MYRTLSSFTLLQATAAIAGLAVLFWSLGFPMLRFAEAANVTTFTNTLSTSEPSEDANHTISFVTPTGMAAGGIVTVGFPVGFNGIDNLDSVDLDFAINGTEQDLVDGNGNATDWGVAPSGQIIEIESGTVAIPANATITIRIGTNATNGGVGVNQLTNPVAVDSYEITVDLDGVDTGTTMVAIVAVVTVTATVETLFTFTVEGVADTLLVNNSSTTITTTPTTIPFGILTDGNRATGAQDLIVNTNAANGFVITVQVDQQLTSANGATIDGFVDGSDVTTPTLWDSPGQILNDPDTWGHWGVTTEDDTLTGGDTFDVNGTGDLYVAVTPTPSEIFRHTGPANGTDSGIGRTRVGYSVEITALQEAGNDYTATLTYVATPVF